MGRISNPLRSSIDRLAEWIRRRNHGAGTFLALALGSCGFRGSNRVCHGSGGTRCPPPGGQLRASESLIGAVLAGAVNLGVVVGRSRTVSVHLRDEDEPSRAPTYGR